MSLKSHQLLTSHVETVCHTDLYSIIQLKKQTLDTHYHALDDILVGMTEYTCFK